MLTLNISRYIIYGSEFETFLTIIKTKGEINMQTKTVVVAGIVAALYVALTLISAAMGLSGGAIQFRLSEALTVLPYFTSAAIPGLFIGCIIANLLTGAVAIDIIFGSIATLLGAVGSWLLRRNKYLVSIPPVIANMVIVPLVLRYAYHLDSAYWYMVLTVGIGEVVCCCFLGNLLLISAEKAMKR